MSSPGMGTCTWGLESRQRESCSFNRTLHDKAPSVIFFHWMVTNPNHHTQGSKSKW